MLSFPKVRACLFDMDGLLLDTEDIYTLCNNVILHQCGRPSLPWNIKAQLQGRPGPEVCHAAKTSYVPILFLLLCYRPVTSSTPGLSCQYLVKNSCYDNPHYSA